MSAAGKSNPLAISGLVVLTLIWSYSWIFMKQVTSYIGAFDFTALRCIFGALVLFIVLLLRGRGMRPTPFKYTLAIALLQTCGMVGLAQWALVSGGAGKVAILSYTMPAVALAGGDLAAKQPWRNLLAQCLRFVPEWQNYPETASVQQQNWSVLARAIERGTMIRLSTETPQPCPNPKQGIRP